jgi:hypothetical protein
VSVHLAVAAAVLALVVPGDHATATYSGHTLKLTLQYEMICGQPGPGPLVVRLPSSFRLAGLRAYVRGVERARAVNDSTVTIDLPKPPQITCMSITEGTLPVKLTNVRATGGTYTVRAQIRRHAFVARLRIR